MTRVLLSDIAFDAGTQIRASIDQQVVGDYADAMTNGAQFPPIVLFHDGNRHYLADGFHRFLAAQRNQFRDIDADVRPGTQQDALWFALGANKTHGKQLNTADKKHAIVIALQAWPDKGPEVLATQIGCTAQYVRDIRHRVASSLDLPSKALGKDGKMHPVTKPSAQHEKRTEIAALVKEGKRSSEICERLGVREELVGKIRRELGVGVDNSRAAVSQRRKDIRDMAERGFATRQIAAAIGIGEQRVSEIAKSDGILIHADRVVGRTKRHDSNRIIAQIVMDAENLTEGVDLIDFNQIDRAQLAGWLKSLQDSRDKLSGFIRRLMKEQRDGEAA